MSGTVEPADTPETAAPAEAEQPQDDDVRARFRAALERKQAKSKARENHADSSKIHEAHGPAASRRTFRRKSG